MTKIDVCRSGSEWTMEVKGHANFAKYGEDIVCAAISTAVTLTANLIEKLDLSYNIIELVCEEGKFILKINPSQELVCAVFENLEFALRDIAKQYPKYIKYNN